MAERWEKSSQLLLLLPGVGYSVTNFSRDAGKTIQLFLLLPGAGYNVTNFGRDAGKAKPVLAVAWGQATM